MDDDQVFGVYDRHTDTVGYCCIMGALGEVLGLAVYMGPDGYTGYRAMQQPNEDWAALDDTYGHLHALVTAFDNREDVQPEDRTIMTRLGLRFRGRRAWPTFRYHRPGKIPLLPSAPHVRHLTRALTEALVVAQVYQNHPDDLVRADHHILVRRPLDDGSAEWISQWEASPIHVYVPPNIAVPAGELDQVRNLGIMRSSWEIDAFYLTGVSDPETGDVPRAHLLVDQERELILDMQVTSDADSIPRMWESMLQKMVDLGGRPEKIFVRQHRVAADLTPLANLLGIPLLQFPVLPLISSARRSVSEQFRPR